MNNKSPQHSAPSIPKVERKSYSRPQLKTYGALREMTDGGSGSNAENMATQMMRHP